MITASITSSSSTSIPSFANKPAPYVTPVWLHAVRRKIEALDYGAVQVVVHDGRVMQIDVTEKTRIERARAGGNPVTLEPANGAVPTGVVAS